MIVSSVRIAVRYAAEHDTGGIMRQGTPPTDYSVTGEEVGDMPPCLDERDDCGIRGVYGWDSDTTGGGLPIED
jgi:hypothetical protein